MGNDDYKADLDVVNITRAMEDLDFDFLHASNNYYQDLKDNKINRANKFKENMDFEEVKKVVERMAPKYEITNILGKKYLGNKITPKSQESFRPLTDQEKLKYIKNNYPDSWKFLESLRQNKNEMISENK
ncbi:hypothetical protein [Xylocopilactobacillus apicola]|uniref:Uncharacterized protein n=1 Tax=Xylocopilactobacillus apicola TaxID=2932184 RepID=A0AAU9DQE5_9LACO|nr:hypothetical protein [Xylocopilactobacillus apicola]BDR59412.1 hypothetical protein XA3_18530 [Xylocopilactobacillus apicola]